MNENLLCIFTYNNVIMKYHITSDVVEALKRTPGLVSQNFDGTAEAME